MLKGGQNATSNGRECKGVASNQIIIERCELLQIEYFETNTRPTYRDCSLGSYRYVRKNGSEFENLVTSSIFDAYVATQFQREILEEAGSKWVQFSSVYTD